MAHASGRDGVRYVQALRTALSLGSSQSRLTSERSCDNLRPVHSAGHLIGGVPRFAESEHDIWLKACLHTDCH
jgi:hypothetical protein